MNPFHPSRRWDCHAEPPDAQVQRGPVLPLEGELCREVNLHRRSQRPVGAENVDPLVKLDAFRRQVESRGNVISKPEVIRDIIVISCVLLLLCGLILSSTATYLIPRYGCLGISPIPSSLKLWRGSTQFASTTNLEECGVLKSCLYWKAGTGNNFSLEERKGNMAKAIINKSVGEMNECQHSKKERNVA